MLIGSVEPVCPGRFSRSSQAYSRGLVPSTQYPPKVDCGPEFWIGESGRKLSCEEWWGSGSKGNMAAVRVTTRLHDFGL